MAGDVFGFGLNGGGGGSSSPEIIEITKADFLTAVSGSQLTFPATYKVTDIDGFTGVYINTTSANSYSPSASGELIVPDYVPSGSNLGQLNPVNPQTVADGERVIWADYYWINNSGAPVVPTILDIVTLDAPMTVIDKSDVVEYQLLNVSIEVDNQLQVSKIYNANNNSTYSYYTTANPIVYLNSPINNNQIVGTDVQDVVNHLGGLFNSKLNGQDAPIRGNVGSYTSIIIDGGNNEFTGNITEDTSVIENIQYGIGSTFKNNEVREDSFIKSVHSFHDNEFENNVVENGSIIVAIELGSSTRFKGNTLNGGTGGSGSQSQIAYCAIWDNSEIINNQLTGAGACIWDVWAGENSKVNGNILSGNETNAGLDTKALISDIDQMNFDEVCDNVLSASSTSIKMCHQFGSSKINSNTLSGTNAKIFYIRQTLSEITGCTLLADNQYKELEMRAAKIMNASGISIVNCEFMNIDLDLTGFTVDIKNQTITSGKGIFTITHDFAANPITSGNSVLYNIIPLGGRITNIVTYGTATGTGQLAFGLETDAPNLLPAAALATVNAGQIYNNLSAAATANRSLIIAASSGDVTGGEITVKVEFVI